MFLFTFFNVGNVLEPPCWKKVKDLKEKRKSIDILLGRGLATFPVSFPNCDDNGYYTLRQCSVFKGCHCVDKYGQRTSKKSLSQWECELLQIKTTSKIEDTTQLQTATSQPTFDAGIDKYWVIKKN